jgi:hypothetical protein
MQPRPGQLIAVVSPPGGFPKSFNSSPQCPLRERPSTIWSIKMLKLFFGSNVGNLAGSANDITQNVNAQFGSNGLKDLLSAGKGLANAGTFANYSSAFSTFYATYKNNNVLGDQKALIKQIEEANGKLSSIEETNSIVANIEHQNSSGKIVYGTSHETRINRGDIETAPTAANPDEPRLNHYFFVLHPSDDWHPAFEKARETNESSLPGFVGYITDRFALGLYLRHMREAIGPDPTFHVLVPSADRYRLPGVVHVYPTMSTMRSHQLRYF